MWTFAGLGKGYLFPATSPYSGWHYLPNNQRSYSYFIYQFREGDGACEGLHLQYQTIVGRLYPGRKFLLQLRMGAHLVRNMGKIAHAGTQLLN